MITCETALLMGCSLEIKQTLVLCDGAVSFFLVCPSPTEFSVVGNEV